MAKQARMASCEGASHELRPRRRLVGAWSCVGLSRMRRFASGMKRDLSGSAKMAAGSRVPALVSTAWLSAQLATVKVVDASWYLPAMKRDARAEFAECRIPGAVFYDVDATDDTSTLPHMVPSAPYFSQMMGDLGVSSEDVVVCYDGKGLFSAARLWWMLRAFGHTQASVLDGGLPAWQRAGLPVDSGKPAPPPAASGPFTSDLSASALCDLKRVRSLVDASEAGGTRTSDPLIVDARSQARFEGTVAEARPNCRSGHMPGARSLPFDRVLSADGMMRPADEVAAVFTEAGVADVNAPLIGSCGSGVTAAVLALALEHAGRTDLLELYDGSWAEYGGDPEQPLATGPAT